MKTAAVLIALAAWFCLLVMPKSTLSMLFQLLVFGLFGAVFTLAGGFSYWWDSGMQPDKKSALILVCGVLILAAQAINLVRAMLDDL